MELRPYQARAVAALRAQWREHPVLCLPTGAGKTVCAAAIIAGAVERGRRALIVSHTRQIVQQTAARFREHGLPVGIVMAEHDERGRPVTVASIQTLARRKLPGIEVVVIDECHHAAGGTYRRLIHEWDAECLLGLTATPRRLDGKGLGDVGFGAIVEPVTYEELFKDGYLLEPAVWAPTVPDLKGERIVAGEYVADSVKKKIAGALVEHWKRLAPDTKTVAFSCTVEHAREIALNFSENGVPAIALSGEDSQVERDAALERLRSGDVRLVANCQLFGEGWDMPELETCIMARPTLSTTVYRQQAGRVMRPCAGKRPPAILDHAGNSLRHGMPWDPAFWTLEDTKQHIPGVAPVKRCPECFAVVPIGVTACPECGFVFIIRSALPDETSEKLRKVESQELAREWYLDTVREAWNRGYKLGWARMRYRDRYGTWPRGIFLDLEKEEFICERHVPKSSQRRTYCERCLRTIHPAESAAGGWVAS